MAEAHTKINRTKMFAYNSISTAFYQLLLMLAGFITPRVMLQFYGSEINGLVSSINQFIVYFSLVEAGLSGAAIYALYKPLADKDHKAINGVVSAAKIFYTQSGYIFLSLTVGLAVLYPLLVKTEGLPPLSIGLLVLILGVNGALEFLTLSKYRVLLSADQRTYVISLASIVHVIVNTLIVVILANLNVSIIVLRFVALLSIFLRSFILMAYVKARYKFIDYNEKPNKEALNKRWDALYMQVLGAIQTGASIVILTIVVKDLKIVSVYTIFNMVLSGLNGVLGIFTSGLSASFGDVIARGDQRTLQKAYREFEFTYYSLISIVYSIAFVTIMPFIRIYTSGVTDINYNLPLIGFLFVLNGIMYNTKTPQAMLVIAAGLYKETRMQTTIQGAITVIGGFTLTPFLGITGVLIASIISNLYRDIDLLFFVPRNLTKLPIIETLLRWIRVVGCVCLVAFPFNFVETNVSGYLTWTLLATVVSFYSFIVVVISGFVFENKNMRRTIKRIISLTGVIK